jgi:hypothetical protein
MGDKSPKSVQKKSKQKQVENQSAAQKKKDAQAAKSTPKKK